MNLSLKQIAIFGRVKVNLNSIDSSLTRYVTLLDLYKSGWWVTDRFGTIITIVKPRNQIKDGFKCVCKRITTDVNLNTLDLLTKPIAEEKYLKYQNRLKSKKQYDKIKKSKEILNENNMSALSPRNNNG